MFAPMQPATKREPVPEQRPEPAREPRLRRRVGRSSGVRPIMRREELGEESSLWPLIAAGVTVVALFGLFALVAAMLD